MARERVREGEAWLRAALVVAAGFRRSLGWEEARSVAQLAAWEAHLRFDPGSAREEFGWCYGRAWGACSDAVRSLRGVRCSNVSPGRDAVRRRIALRTVSVELLPGWEPVADVDVEAAGLRCTESVADLVRRFGATQRERRILEMLAEGHNQTVIGSALGVSSSLVNKMLRRMRDRAVELQAV